MVDDQRQGGEEMHKDVVHNPKSPLAEREEKTLEFWNRNDIFKKSVEKPAPKGDFVFYDGPPFANGLPHYGHLLQSSIKDAIPRYRTMQGYRVARRWGWDCHGLPVENLVEKEKGFKGKRDIEDFGIGNFNEAARTSIMKDVADWKRIIPRIGRWADMEDDYKTMDASYTESVWWAFKNLFDRGLVYEGFKGMHLCPRCGTTLSNFEVAQGYVDIDDIAVFVKLPLVDEPETSLLVWTTTPWTLPGNTAAALNANATYVKARTDEGFVIVAKDLAEKVLGENPKIFGEMPGRELVGKRYEPPFPYFKDQLHKHKTHAYKVYAAPYVTLEDGTGIVHLAPAYGAEDLVFAQKEKIPLIQHVTDEGKFIATVSDFAGLPVKPKGRHMETDAKIVEHLQSKGRLFKQEKVNHSYPHCWRCDTPLLNWASNSWFVSVSKIKPKLLTENKKVRWVPEKTGTGRFHNGLESAPDWAISRSRYWGAPLPVWRHTKTKEIKVLGSVDELLSMVRRSGNTYFLMRHGFSQSNAEEFMDSDNSRENHLTQKGREQVEESAKKLAQKTTIDMIIVSPLVRAQETAQIIKKHFNLADSAVMTEERLRERGMGEFNGKPRNEFLAAFKTFADHFTASPRGAESLVALRRRSGDFLFDIERRYTNKKILIITHGDPAWCLSSVAERTHLKHWIGLDKQSGYLDQGSWCQLPFTPFPHNSDFELDLHRPYIDEVPMGNSLDGEWKRVPDVFDCWFESGSMPFASNHYPFEKDVFNPKNLFGLSPKGYPADFIAEAVDQTRGWFYSLIVLGTALFGRAPYKNIITTGLINAADGKKMSKRLKNYPDPLELIEKYGVDSLRYYMLSSQLVRGEDLNFQERGVEEVSKKLVMRLDNVASFYELYKDGTERSEGSTHVLDRWVRTRLSQMLKESTEGFEKYELDVAMRPLSAFIDDLSTWYLRRSRDRFKSESNQDALSTLRFVLFTLAHAMAPMMPFFAEELFQRTKQEGDAESVHLSHWPASGSVDGALVRDMKQISVLSTAGLQAREKAGIKLRQPLALMKVKELPDNDELRELLRDELNVKALESDASLAGEVWLDTTITPELKEEGVVRDVARRIQEWRKEQKLHINDRPACTLVVSAEEKAVGEKHKTALAQQTGLSSLNFEERIDA